MNNLMEYIGQFFIVSFKGSIPSHKFLKFVREKNIGGVILFKDNCPTHLDAKNVIDIIKSNCPTNPFIAVDQEGGRVSRILGAPAQIASAWEYGSNLGLEKFSEDYDRCLLLLDSLGINLNLAPVADIFLNSDNSCLESRCFGDSSKKVIPFVKRAVEISKRCSMISCAKHFPGLGDTTIDPHLQTAKSDYDLKQWERREKNIFSEAIASGVNLIMTTHLLLENIDSTIATGSKIIVGQMLREQLGFEGPVITDDLTMKGAESLGTIGERTVKAFQAGHDLLLFGQDFESAKTAYEYFYNACQNGEISKERVIASLERLSGIKFKLNKSVIY